MRDLGLSKTFPLSAAGMLVCGLCVSLTLFFLAFRQEQRSEQADFERRTKFRVVAIEQGVSNAMEALQVLNALFATNGSVSREQFHSFTEPLLARYPYIEAFAFSRLLSQAERPGFEAQMRLRDPGFMIADGVAGKRIPAAVKDRYSVIEYLEPMTGNEPAFGFDTSSLPFLDNVIRRTTDTGLPAATGLYPISKEAGPQRVFRLLMPVYQRGAALGTRALRQRAVVGYTIALLRADALFEKILAPVDAPGNVGLDIRVYASASGDESKLIYGLAGTASKQRDWLQLEWWLGSRSEPVVHGFDVAGTAWQMVVSLKPTPLLATHSSSLLTLLIGLLTTVSATAYLRSAALRTQRIEQMVAERTDELKKVNDFLIDDILLRRQTEQALVSSEEHMRELAELSSDWFWEQDEQFRYTAFTGEACKSGLPAEVVLGRTRWDLPVDPEASDWPAHRALLEAHKPFKNFEFKALSTIQIDGLPVQWFSASGKPQFDDQGLFKGYRGTSENISARKWAEEELIHSRVELRKLADHQATATENERKRIARDIHDDLGQHLMALRIDISVLAGRSAAVTVTEEWINATLKQIDVSITAVRAIINDLRPAMLDFGLHAAIEWQVTKFEQRTGIACQLQLGNEEFALDDQCTTALFRIVQEALTNIQRHAKARQVWIGMQRINDRLLMTIVDDGIGIVDNSVKKPDSFGLIGIEERIGALGGTLSIDSTPGQGMALVLSIPLQTTATEGSHLPRGNGHDGCRHPENSKFTADVFAIAQNKLTRK